MSLMAEVSLKAPYMKSPKSVLAPFEGRLWWVGEDWNTLYLASPVSAPKLLFLAAMHSLGRDILECEI